MKLQGTMQINDKGHLEIGGCDTVELAETFGTPLYVLDEQHFRQNCRNYYRAFIEKYDGVVLYAAKTLLTLAVCRMVAEEGLSLDVVSGGELYTAKKARFPMERVYFHGNNKSAAELQLALEYNVGRIMVDNPHELQMLNRLAGEAGVRAKIMLRLTPGVEAHTHEYIKTGQIDSKFGMVIENGQAMEIIKQALALDNVQLTGLHCHIGSQIFELQSYTHAAEVMLGFAAEVYRETGWQPGEMNFGGGMGIYYTEADKPQPVSKYADMLVQAVQNLAQSHGLAVPRVLVEPGRSISGPAGTTLYTVGAVKNIPGIRKYVAVDGGMGDNPRPALYQSRYEAILANRAAEKPGETVSIAGKCCESGDMLIWDIELPAPVPGDILAVSSTGAYNYSMSMNYNRLPRPAMVLVRDGAADIIVARETYEDLIRNDVVPERLGGGRVVKIAGAGR
ncbi:diaminopimelate decarboxylase [Desulfallas thermosapovorans]|uniref:Diaminopimelate decarboxylase n=1 Tax=Desulfallas thermosapovorans DSM 6562 TaxID=1121431 RepID=A0A5S4ZTR0_9FIRM|nr:diaminopimelate decarboxylase [Desulfallas thermosapovorans]TYO95583.1 diaminopimelate decarboxylase [Desulfallas thermosapovorans DSM 6562]